MTKPKIIRRPDYFWFSHENFGFFQLLDDNTPGHQTSTARRTHLAMTIAGGPGPNFAAGVKNSRLGPPDQTGGTTFGLVGPNTHLRPTGAPNKLSTTRSVSQTKIARSEASHRTNIARSSAYQQIKQSSVYQTIHITLDMLGR
jgi:hypothetical protein